MCGSSGGKSKAPGQKRSPPSLLVHLEISTDSSLGPGPDDESAETSKCTSRGREISSKRYCPGLSRIDPLNRRTTLGISRPRRWRDGRGRWRVDHLEVARMGACEDRGARCGDLVENGFVVEIGRVDRRLLERAAQVLFWRARYDAAECARRSHAHASQWLRLTPAGPAPQQARPRPTPGACHAARSGSRPRPLPCLFGRFVLLYRARTILHGGSRTNTASKA